MPLDPADVVIALLFGGYALWSISFWIALAFGVGWGLAGPLFAAGAIATAALSRPRLVGRSVAWSDLRGSSAAWIVVAAAAASAAVGSSGPARLVLAVAAVATLAFVEHLRVPTRWDRRDIALLGGAAALATVIFFTWFGFIAGVVVMTAWVARAETSTPRHLADRRGESTERPAALNGPVLGAGALFGLYTLLSTNYALDQGHYLNKSLHYAEHPWSFGVRDYMFGVDGADHIPRGTILNSFETGIGALSALTRVDVVPLTYHLVVPFVAFVAPIGLAWAARELGARRPDLVACVALLAMVSFPDGHDARHLILKFAEGKSSAGLLAMVVFVGAMIRLVRRNDTTSVILACAVGVATYGLSSTAGIALMPAAVAAVFAGALTHLDAPDRNGRILRSAIPVGLVVVLTGVGTLVHRTISTGLDRFSSSFEPWLSRFAGDGANVTTEGEVAEIWLLIFCVALVILFGATRLQRLYFATITAGLVLVVYNPVLFATVWDTLGVTGLSWRAGWALPVGLAVGLAADTLGSTDDGPGGGWIGPALIAAVLAIGVSPVATTTMESPASFPDRDREAAEALVEATPPGGRFFGPDWVEVTAIALTADRYPTIVRPYFVRDLASYDDLPDEFLPAERLALAQMIRTAPMGRLADRASTKDPAELLDLLAIDAVCVPERANPQLRTELRDSWVLVSEERLCTVFARP
jgi:hypothetical protein